ncbi:MAG TPA: aspartate carbamoyltransferase catalytic subunit [Proteobacteria bacterium]|nr:aspartate carbamoyltransferase [bacterium BMS3Abin14]HDL53161.1 aspartate carbamoyltransferase catalytic subunit [Pseudomonadota bacterium]
MIGNSSHLIGLDGLTAGDITRVLDTAAGMKEIPARKIKKVPALRGKTVINLFFEPSTRTRTSFEIAAKRLSADAVNFASSSSSTSKGETLIDTAKNLESMAPDVVVIRHRYSGAPGMLAERLNCSVVNAGDGSHQHPTQGLLDLFTVREAKGRIGGLKVAIIGDITHSRVARSDIWGFTAMGAEVFVSGPPTMIPRGIDHMGAKVAGSFDEAIDNADVIIMLRIQLERKSGSLIPTLREYSRFFGLNSEKLKLARDDVTIMHPGPVNRGVEISSDIVDGAHSVILDQVENGVAVRMAVLYLLGGGSNEMAD